MNRIVAAGLVAAILAIGGMAAAVVIPSGGSRRTGTTAPKRPEPPTTSTGTGITVPQGTEASTTSTSANGIAPVLSIGPVPDREQCNANVSTDLNAPNCPLAEAVYAGVVAAYQKNRQVPAHVSVSDPTTGGTQTVSCEVRGGAVNYRDDEVYCYSAGGDETFGVSSVEAAPASSAQSSAVVHCADVGPPGTDVGLYQISAEHISCSNARSVLNAWYNDSSAPQSGPRGWICSKRQTEPYAYRTTCRQGDAVIEFTQFTA